MWKRHRIFTISAIGLAICSVVCFSLAVHDAKIEFAVLDHMLFYRHHGLLGIELCDGAHREMDNFPGGNSQTVEWRRLAVDIKQRTFADGYVAWNAEIAEWWIFAGLSLLPSIWLAMWARRTRRLQNGWCVDCGYDLRESAGECPECTAGRGVRDLSQRNPIWAFIALAGAAAAIVIIILALLAVWRGESIRVDVWRVRLAADEEYLEAEILIEGDPEWFRTKVTRNVWGYYGYRWRGEAVYCEVRDSVGSTVQGRRVLVAGSTWWFAVLLIQPWLWTLVVRGRKKRAALMEGCCTNCGYDLRGVGGRCPECGADRQPAGAGARWVSARMWRRRPVFTAFALLSAIAALTIVVACFVTYDGYRRAMDFKLSEPWEVRINRGSVWVYNCGMPANPDPSWPGSLAIGCYNQEIDVVPGVPVRLFSLRLHLLYPFLLSLILPVWWLRTRRRDRMTIVARSCNACWFDMKGATGPCPRCGKMR